jgi:hypothetical protein
MANGGKMENKRLEIESGIELGYRKNILEH